MTSSHVNPTSEAALFGPARAVDGFIGTVLRAAPLPLALRAAVEYAVLGPGKRLRPVLCTHACVALGGEAAGALPASAALELIHAFSLVHDDLPGMDNDDYRRGRPTLHRATSEAMAILAGDAMHTLAFRVLGQHGGALGAALESELAEATVAMIAGQAYDTLGGFPDGLSPLERVQLVHANKTGSLIRCACRMGAISAGADEAGLRMLTEVGESLGLMFQIVDDIIDVTQSAEHAGKKTGKDAEAGKLTYPGVLGLEGSQREVVQLRDRAIAALGPLGPGAEAMRMLCIHLATRTK